MTSIFAGYGYYMNDDRASGGKFVEDDVFTCGHFPCQKVIKKSDWKLHGGYCRCYACDRFICPSCYDRAKEFGCEVVEKVLTKKLDEQYRIEQNRKVMGI